METLSLKCMGGVSPNFSSIIYQMDIQAINIYYYLYDAYSLEIFERPGNFEFSGSDIKSMPVNECHASKFL